MGKKPVAPVLGADGSLPLLTGTQQVIGGRKYQEDRSVCIADINPMALKHHPDLDGTRRAFFAVFDGFGGDQSSEWLKLHFFSSLIRHKALVSNPEQAVRETFASTDEELLRTMESQDLKRGTGPALVRSGSCGTVCLVVGNEAFIGNVGDSSAVVFRRKGAAGSSTEMLSTDHKASEPSERERIAAAGGTTEQKTQNVTGFLCWASKAVPVGPVRVQPGGPNPSPNPWRPTPNPNPWRNHPGPIFGGLTLVLILGGLTLALTLGDRASSASPSPNPALTLP